MEATRALDDPVEIVLVRIGTTREGLTGPEAAARLAHVGPNVVHERRRSLVFDFLSRFTNPLVVLLLVASAISAATGDVSSFVIISTMVALSVTLDFVQEYRAGQAAEALESRVGLRFEALRDGQWREVPQEALVPGDVVRLCAGDLIPADGRLLESRDFFVNQALLTGESYPVEKRLSRGTAASESGDDEHDVLYKGTAVVSGTALFVVCCTGRATKLGEISGRLAQRPPPNAFEIGTHRFGLLIMRTTVLLTLLALMVNTSLGRPWLESFLFAVALAVGLTPELLPMVVSVTLARGALRMAKKKVIVKQLTSIQNLGAMDVLCTDKTGTLTEARVRLERHLDPQGCESERVLFLAYLNSWFEQGIRSPLDEAILAHEHVDITGWTKIDEVPFDFERRRISVLVEQADRRLLVVKGALEDVLALSSEAETREGEASEPLTDEVRERITRAFEALGEEGFRVLGVAWREFGPERDHARVDDEAALIFAGLAAFLDPPKASAARALERLANSGVNVKIVTGDNERVTRHVCTQLGLEAATVLTGAEIAAMNDDALRAHVETTRLFCRVKPAEKNRVILALKANGHAVGYLGDGINDAPSMHSADVGISVEGATDVARAAAGMILLESDLSVLHDGVMEGRVTFGNVMKYIMMGTSSNFGNMFSMAAATLVLPFLPMLPLQILLNNFLYDLSESAVPTDRVDDEDLVRPRRWDMRFILAYMLAMGPISSVFDFLTFYLMLHVFMANEALFHTGWFVESLVTQVLVIFVIRTRRNPLQSRPSAALTATSLGVVAFAAALPFTPLAPWLGFVPPPAAFYGVLACMALAYLLTMEGAKRLLYRTWSRHERQC